MFNAIGKFDLHLTISNIHGTLLKQATYVGCIKIGFNIYNEKTTDWSIQ